jgi:peptide/nickel transport system ATP-binding protein
MPKKEERAMSEKERKDYTKGPLCLSGRGVTRIFGSGAKANTAVDHVDFDFHEGEFVSIVGESGSGKTTLSKMLLGLLNVSEGEILFQGKPRDISTRAKRNEYWKGIQAIFQDPFASYNIFHKIDAVLLDCINMRGGKNLPYEKKVEMMTEACSFVNLKFAELTNKYPFELSGGQMQRLMIARIFLLKPKILLADEPTSMVDACSRATILDMLLNLRDETGMTIIFITHDIGLAYYISDTVYIMEHGKFVEFGKADEVILNPKAPYTKRLISDVPKIHEEWDLSTVDLTDDQY